MSIPVETIKGHQYHGAPQDAIVARLRAELKEAKEDRDREKALRKQYETNNRCKVIRDVAEDMDDLASLASIGWPREVCGQSGNHPGSGGDGKAAAKMGEVETQLFGIHLSVKKFLKVREAEVRGTLVDNETVEFAS